MRLNAALGALLLASCASRTSSIPLAWMDVPHASTIAAVSIAEDGKVSPLPSAPKPAGNVRIERTSSGERLFAGQTALTGELNAIGAFDVSQERQEVIFSARNGASFDIGLAAMNGADTHWLPADPADEIEVQWAPRGNKISYVVRSRF